MLSFREEVMQLTTAAKELHAKEGSLHLESCRIIARLEYLGGSVSMGMTKEAFAKALGLSIDVYWKRAQAGRLMLYFPKVEDMVKLGEIQLSHVNLIAPHLTQANADILLERIKGKTTREVQYAVSTTTLKGEVIDKEPEVELRVLLKRSTLEKLDRVIDVLSAGGKVTSKEEALARAFEALLEKHDPLRKAERAAVRLKKRQERKPTSETPDGDQEPVSPMEPVPISRHEPRPAIAALKKHTVYLRDVGQCTYIDADGSRCPEKRMVEIDHIRMWCRGGDHSIDNMRLRCRSHNQATAKQQLGVDYFRSKVEKPSNQNFLIAPRSE